MERRLIDAKEAYELAYEGGYYADFACSLADLTSLKDLLDDCTTIDAVEVVRCRECMRFREYSEEYKATVENADGDCAIRKWYSDDEQLYAVTKDDYCSLGKRREHDGE